MGDSGNGIGVGNDISGNVNNSLQRQMVYFPKFNTIFGTKCLGRKKGEQLFSRFCAPKGRPCQGCGYAGAPQISVCHSLPVWQPGEHRVTEALGWVSRDLNVMETNCSGYQTQ